MDPLASSRPIFERHVARLPRVPWFAPITASGLRGCWSTNISPGGLGLTAQVAGGPLPRRGDELELELALGEGRGTIRVVARVAWTGPRRGDGRVFFGVQFCELSPPARTTLARFLAEQRPRVLVALASAEQRERAARALHELDVELVALDDADELDGDQVRACASVLVFSDDGARLTSLLEAIGAAAGAGPLPADIPRAPITLCGDVDDATVLRLIGDGALYQALPARAEPTALGLAIERSCERWALQLELRWASLQLEVATAVPPPPPVRVAAPVRAPAPVTIVRESARMRRVYELVATVAVHDVPVLLNGETGTGKELAAREIHALSKRAKTPFVTQDCGALTETLLESELFGHVRGAFTGAAGDHPGLFQLADRGTIFLDEIQNTSPALQAKLLRVIEHGDLRPVGSARSRKVDVRVIAASNVDLRQAVREQRFRADFFYRLNRFPIELPPLRDHPEDILPLAHFFVDRLADSLGRAAQRVDPRTERALVAYDWPGNIRELRNAMERALLLTPAGEPIRWETLPPEVTGHALALPPTDDGLDAQLERFERTLIQVTLERHQGVIRRAARELSMNAVTLSRRMRRLGLLDARRPRPTRPTTRG